jgi:hypothetical protein
MQFIFHTQLQLIAKLSIIKNITPEIYLANPTENGGKHPFSTEKP